MAKNKDFKEEAKRLADFINIFRIVGIIIMVIGAIVVGYLYLDGIGDNGVSFWCLVCAIIAPIFYHINMKWLELMLLK